MLSSGEKSCRQREVGGQKTKFRREDGKIQVKYKMVRDNKIQTEYKIDVAEGWAQGAESNSSSEREGGGTEPGESGGGDDEEGTNLG